MTKSLIAGSAALPVATFTSLEASIAARPFALSTAFLAVGEHTPALQIMLLGR